MALQVKRGTGGNAPSSAMRTATAKQSSELKSVAKRDGLTDKDVAVKVLSMSQNEINNYIRARGEVPVDTLPGRILQAALLRMEDISLVQRTTGISEDAALAHVEEAESDAVKNNTAERLKILKPSTQAALNEIIDQIVNEVSGKTTATGISGSLDVIRRSMITPRSHNSLPSNFTSTMIVKGAYNGFDISTEFPPAPPTNNSGSIPATGPANSSDDSKTIWDLITAIGATSGQVAGAVNSIGGSLNQIGGGIGASSIEQYLSANWWKVFLFILVAIVITVILIRVSANNK